MRRLLGLVAAGVLALTACSSSEPTRLDAAAAPTTDTAAAPTTDAAAASVAEAAPEPLVLPTGREALAAVQGQPHVLWFWGAH